MLNPYQSIDEQASNFLTDMIDADVIDTPFEPFDDRLFYVNYFEWFLKEVAPNKRSWQDRDWFDLSTQAQTQRWQEHRFDTVIHPVSGVNYWAVELAQFAVPNGSVGWVRHIEQVVNDVNGGYYPTNVTYWGSPHYMLSDVNNLRWYFTLSEYDGRRPDRFELASATPIPIHALPGWPYPDLPEIDGIWYPAHLQRRMKLIVPRKSVLRFFMITPPTVDYTWQVSGKLSGMTQSTFQDCAVRNSREIY